MRRALVAVLLVGMPGAAAAATGTAAATTLRPATVLRTADLDFGNIAPAATGGTVTINPNTDARTRTGAVTLLAGGRPGAAKFTASGAPSVVVLVRLPTGAITLSNGAGGSMTVTNLTTNGPTARTFGGAGALTITVAGRLNVGANQATGAYAGQFVLTVDYP